jgi:hypothetical protein
LTSHMVALTVGAQRPIQGRSSRLEPSREYLHYRRTRWSWRPECSWCSWIGSQRGRSKCAGRWLPWSSMDDRR